MSATKAPRGPRLSLGAVAILGGVAAGFAFLVGAVSLTRIAGDYLGFPPDLEWTFTGAVDVAGIAGGIMWAAFSGDIRGIGRAMNIVCTTVSGIGVGLDHLTHAGRALRVEGADPALPGSADVWPIAAFAAGLFVPALATWILHALSLIADTARAGGAAADRTVGDEVTDRQRTASVASPDRQPGSPAAYHQATTRPSPASPAGGRQPVASPAASGAGEAPARPPADTVGDRQDVLVVTASDTASGALTVTTRPAATTRPASPPARKPTPPPPVDTTPKQARPTARQDWMTDLLVHQVARKLAAAAAAGDTYGRPQLMAEHSLTDYRARALLAYIAERDLAREAAS